MITASVLEWTSNNFVSGSLRRVVKVSVCNKRSRGPRGPKKSKTPDRVQSHPERVEMRRRCQRSEILGLSLTNSGSFPTTKELSSAHPCRVDECSSSSQSDLPMILSLVKIRRSEGERRPAHHGRLIYGVPRRNYAMLSGCRRGWLFARHGSWGLSFASSYEGCRSVRCGLRLCCCSVQREGKGEGVPRRAYTR